LGRRTCNREVAGLSPGRSAPRATLGKLFTYLCLCSPSSINWYRRKLGAKQALHATHWLRVRGLAASAGVWLRAIEMEISAALWARPCVSGRTLAFYNFSNMLLILCVKYFYRWLRFKVIIDKSCNGATFFLDTMHISRLA